MPIPDVASRRALRYRRADREQLALRIALGMLALALSGPVVIGGDPSADAAVTFTVTSTTDAIDASPVDGLCAVAALAGACTLREALREVNTGPVGTGPHTISLPAGTFPNTGLGVEFAVTTTEPLTIQGVGSSSAIGGGDVNRVLLIGALADVTLTDVSVRDGYVNAAGGGGIRNLGTLVLDATTITANECDACEGIGVYNETTGSLTVQGSTFSLNVPRSVLGSWGGGISNRGTMSVDNSTFDANGHATLWSWGGAIDTFTDLVVTNSTFTNNRATSGGAISTENSTDPDLTLLDNDMSGNQAGTGGCVYHNVAGDLLVDGGLYTGNSGVNGSCFYSNSSGGTDATIRNVEVSFNTAPPGCCGGPIHVDGDAGVNTDVLIENVNVHDNVSGSYLAGVAVLFAATATVRNSTIVDNTAALNSGGLAFLNKTNIVDNVTSSRNHVGQNGGGCYCFVSYPGGSTTITDSTFADNDADTDLNGDGHGGALYLGGQPDSTFTLTNVDVAGNDAHASNGGGIYLTGVSSADFDNVNVTGNAADDGAGIWTDTVITAVGPIVTETNVGTGRGGGIYLEANGQLIDSNWSIRNNQAATGGGIHNLGSDLVVRDISIENNVATNRGGGYYEEGGDNILLEDMTLFRNTAGNDGGGAYQEEDSNLTTWRMVSVLENDATAGDGGGLWLYALTDMQDVRVIDNTAGNDGGGIFDQAYGTGTRVTSARNDTGGDGGGLASIYSGIVWLNSTFADNVAGGRGGGVFSRDDGAQNGVAMTHVTIAHNQANSGGGYYDTQDFASPLGMPMTNVLVGDNLDATPSGFAALNEQCEGDAFPQDLANNLSSDASCSFTGGGSIQNGVINLGPLQNNGGFPETREPQAGSAAIDNANDAFAPAADERLLSRPQGAISDIGAVEVRFGADLSITKTADDTDPQLNQQITYTLTVTNNGPHTATNVVTSDTLDANLTYVSNSSNAAVTCAAVSQVVTCQLPDLQVFTTVVVSLVVTVNGTGAIANTGSVVTATPDPTPSNNSSTASVLAGQAFLANGTLPFTGTDAEGHFWIGLWLLLAGCGCAGLTRAAGQEASGSRDNPLV